MRLSTVLVGICLLVIMSTGFMMFLAQGIDTYNPSGVPEDYNKTFTNLNNLTKQFAVDVNSSKDEVTDTESDNRNAVADFLGFYFGKAYGAAKTIVLGVGLTGTVVDTATEATLGGTGYFSEVVGGTVLLIIGIFGLLLLLAFVIKSDWL